jgi:flagellar biosynthesis/type III secretory pathway protein FliH
MPQATVLKAGQVRIVRLDDPGTADRKAAAAEAATRQRVELEAAYQAGLADGQRAAEAAGLGAMPDVAVAIKAATAELGDRIAGRAVADADALVGYAVEIARWILGRELAADTGLVTARIEAALETLMPNGRLVIRVAPAAVDLVARWAEGRDADVIGDAALAPGEARLDAGNAGADLTWAQAFRRVQEAFDDTSSGEASADRAFTGQDLAA